ncbi:cupin domain-containing protein [Halobacteriaceae archaeon GCM10025711]
MVDGYSVVGIDDVDAEPFPESGVLHRKLTPSLGATEMRVNALTLAPGEELEYHRHERQEELYVPLNGSGEVKIDGDVVEVPENGVVRVAADVPRKLLNTADDDRQWLMFGAPPVGTLEDFGEYVVVEEPID